MTIIIILVLLLQLVAPVLLLYWLWRGGGRWRLAVKGLITALYLLLIALAGLWMFLPSWLIWGYAGAAGVMAALGAAHGRSAPFTRRAAILSIAAAIGVAGLTIYAASGKREPSGAVDLHPPLLDGRYYVVSGGSNALLNLHMETIDKPAYRGQSYAVDVVALNRIGVRTKRLFPNGLEDYEIYGAPIYAPCTGSIMQAENGLPDMQPPQVDAQHMPGNHVLIDCKDVLVLIAHMQHGSVRVRNGDLVHSGQILGNVGNSGNTGEPHLHIHAQRRSTNDSLYGGEPVPMRFMGRYLTRNDRM